MTNASSPPREWKQTPSPATCASTVRGERLEVAARERAQRAGVRGARPAVLVDRLVVAARLAPIVRQQVQWLLGDGHAS